MRASGVRPRICEGPAGEQQVTLHDKRPACLFDGGLLDKPANVGKHALLRDLLTGVRRVAKLDPSEVARLQIRVGEPICRTVSMRSLRGCQKLSGHTHRVDVPTPAWGAERPRHDLPAPGPCNGRRRSSYQL